MNDLSPTASIYTKKAELLKLTSQVVDPNVKKRIQEQLSKIEIGTLVFVTEPDEYDLTLENAEIISAVKSLTNIEIELQSNLRNNTLARTLDITTLAQGRLTEILANGCKIFTLPKLYS